MMVFEALRLDKTAAREYVDAATDAPFEAQSAQQLGSRVRVLPGSYLPAIAAGGLTAGGLALLMRHAAIGGDGPVSTLLALGGGAYAGHRVHKALAAREAARDARER